MSEALKNQLNEIKKFRNMTKKKHYKKSRLDKYQSEILILRKSGASLAEIKVWLRDNNIVIERSTILRRIQFWGKFNA